MKVVEVLLIKPAFTQLEFITRFLFRDFISTFFVSNDSLSFR